MQTKRRSSSPLKWHGGKHYLAAKIVDLMPPHLHYVEPYAGGLSVLLVKNPVGISEVVNDIHFELSTFWRVLAEESHFREFLRLVQATPFSEVSWKEAASSYVLSLYELAIPAAVTAANFFIRCRQSLAGRMDTFAPLSRTRTRRGMNEQASAWLNAIEGLPAVHERLKRVVILNRDALDVIRQQDGTDTLFYLDPPYLHETRKATEVYDHEMTKEQHEALLSHLLMLEGKFILSGYRSELYDYYAEQGGWRREEFELPNNAAGGKSKRRMTEVVWMNYEGAVVKNHPPSSREET